MPTETVVAPIDFINTLKIDCPKRTKNKSNRRRRIPLKSNCSTNYRFLSHDGEYVSFNFPEKLLAFYSDSAMERNHVLPYTNSHLVSMVIKGDGEWQKQILQILWEMKKKFDRKRIMGMAV